MKHSTIMLAAWAVVACLASGAWAQQAGPTRPASAATSPAVLLEKGIYTEETVGDLDAAIKVYQQIIDDAKANRRYVAEAHYRLGECLMKKGQAKQALEVFQRLVDGFPEQKKLLSRATTRIAAARKKFPDEQVAEIVSNAVKTISTCAETDPRVRPALASMEGLDDQAVAKELAKFLDSERNTIRRSAIYILWKGDLTEIAAAVPGLQKLCKHEEDLTRGMAALALGGRKIDSSFQTICDMTLKDESPYARRCAAYALGLMGRADAKAVLEKALKDKEAFVRNNAEAALTMLERSGQDPDIPSLHSTNTNENFAFPEIVGCRVKRTLHLELKATGAKLPPIRHSMFEADLLEFTWTPSPKLTQEIGYYAVVAVPPVAKGSINDVSQHTWSAVGIPADVHSAAYGQVFPGALNTPAKSLKPGHYTVHVLAYTGPFERGDDRQPIAGRQIDLAVKLLPITQIVIKDVQADGSLSFRSIQQHRNLTAQPIKETGFINSDFVHVKEMTDDAGKPIRFTSQHEGQIYRYRARFNKPVLPGEVVLSSSSGTMHSLIRQNPDRPGEFVYRMRHFPATNSPTHRIEIHRLPAGAKLLQISPASLPHRKKDGRVEIFVDEMIKPGGSLEVVYRYTLGGSPRPQVVVKRQRHFVKLVLGKGRMTFQGQDVTWGELPGLLDKVPNRPHTVLEVGVASEDVPAKVLMDALNLATKHGFEYGSSVGPAKLAEMGSPSQMAVTVARTATYTATGSYPPSAADKRQAEKLAAEGWRLWNQRKVVEAEAKFTEAVSKNPGDSNAWNGLGWAQFNQHKSLNAKESFQMAVKVDPKQAGALNGLGWIAKAQGKTDEAVRFWQQAVEALPSATAAMNGLAGTLYEQGQYEKAAQYYQAWLKIEADSAEAKAGLAKTEAAQKAVKAAVPAAQDWLKLVDAGKYGQSWDAAAEFFRKAVAKDKWEQQLQAARTPLGTAQSRKLLSAVFAASLPGAPDGQYVVIQFQTVFEHKKQAVETVTPMKGDDGAWRVSGYYIK